MNVSSESLCSCVWFGIHIKLIKGCGVGILFEFWKMDTVTKPGKGNEIMEQNAINGVDY